MNKEDVSLLVDGEVTPAACRDLLDELSADRDMRRTWARYHLIGELMRSPESTQPHQAERHVPHLPRAVAPAATPRYRPRPWTGIAIAAGIAALALTVLLRAPGNDLPAPNALVLNEAPSPATLPPDPNGALLTAADGTAGDPAVIPALAFKNEQRLNGYLVNFNEQRARLGVPGVHPYVRIVGFEPR